VAVKFWLLRLYETVELPSGVRLFHLRPKAKAPLLFPHQPFLWAFPHQKPAKINNYEDHEKKKW
jgi:hypothetical protein